jgi:hypothetical protein
MIVTQNYWTSPNWRDDVTLEHHSFYKKKWAFRPVICSDGTKVWFNNYYSYFRIWRNKHHSVSGTYRHCDFIENITEAEYLVRKLADNL